MLSNFSKMLLIEGLTDWVMLSSLKMGFLGRKPSVDEFISESRSALDPLLRDGLMVMGDLTSPDKGFRLWNLSVDESLNKFEQAYRDDPEDRKALWSWGMWLSLTLKGRPFAEECYSENPDPLGISSWRD